LVVGIAEPRSAWTTFKPSFTTGPTLVKVAYVHHSAFPSGGGVVGVEEEHRRMRSIEDTHINERGFIAIGYSKVVFGSGRTCDGRGWGLKQGGNFDGGTNETTYSICFDGDFTSKSPTDAAFATAARLLVEGVAEGFIHPDFELRRHGMEIVPPGVPGKEHCAGRTVLECTGKDCPGRGVYEHFDRLLEEDPLATLSDDEVKQLLADTAVVADYIRRLKEAGSKASSVDAALGRIAAIERKVDALAAAVSQLGRDRPPVR
jgi:N-acetylmuramoyl-L-alanine amidase